MSEKFSAAPVEHDTRIFFSGETELEGFEILYQIWGWEGYRAESIIFAAGDVRALSEDDIRDIVQRCPKVKQGSEITVKADDGFVFCNFNFESDRDEDDS